MSNTITKQERDEAIARLRELLPPGSIVTTVLRHVSRSGMQRSISCVIASPDGPDRNQAIPHDIDYWVRHATGLPFDRNHGGLKVNGCGMDMGFHLVYSLSRILYRDTFTCIGERCPSNDHSNGDRDYSPHTHSDGGYALRHRWL